MTYYNNTYFAFNQALNRSDIITFEDREHLTLKKLKVNYY